MTVQFSGTQVKSAAEVREHLKGIRKPDELVNRLRALGSSGTAMVLGIPEGRVMKDGFSGVADAFIRSNAVANN